MVAVTDAVTDLADEQLLAAARRGDRPALEALLERQQSRVFRFGMKMCRNPEDAKDILQETLLAMARTVRDFRGASSISTWLYTIARSFCIKKRRRSKFAPAVESSLEGAVDRAAERVPSPAVGPEEELAGRQVEQALEQAIASLRPMYREVMVLRDVEGLPAAEVAQVLGLTVDAVKTRLHRARLMVRDKVAPLLGVTVTAPRSGQRRRCPDVLRTLSRYLEGEISSNVCARMEKHVRECPPCGDACDSLKRVLALCQAAPEPQVPAEIQDSVRQVVRQLLDRP